MYTVVECALGKEHPNGGWIQTKHVGVLIINY
jgi:hypothetical protein